MSFQRQLNLTQLCSLFLLVAVAMASQPITSLNLIEALSREGAQQYSKLSIQQQNTVVAELAAMPIKTQDANSLRFSEKGKVLELAG